MGRESEYHGYLREMFVYSYQSNFYTLAFKNVGVLYMYYTLYRCWLSVRLSLKLLLNPLRDFNETNI
jgi:hypothetical protein